MSSSLIASLIFSATREAIAARAPMRGLISFTLAALLRIACHRHKHVIALDLDIGDRRRGLDRHGQRNRGDRVIDEDRFARRACGALRTLWPLRTGWALRAGSTCSALLTPRALRTSGALRADDIACVDLRPITHREDEITGLVDRRRNDVRRA